MATRHACDAVEGVQVKYVMGIGCHSEATPDEIVALIHSVLREYHVEAGMISAIATGWMKAEAENIAHAAQLLQWPLRVMSQAQCRAVAQRAITQSARVLTVYGVPSVAETAALAAAGKNAQLLGARINSAVASCAIVQCEVARGEGI